MPGTTLSATVQRQLEAVNAHDARAFAAQYSPTATVFDPAYPELLQGTGAIEKDMADFFEAFPDLQVTIDRVLDNGEWSAYETTMRGTHLGSLISPTGHIPATHRRIAIAGVVLARFAPDGRVQEERRYYDLMGLLGQLGQLQ